MSETPKTPTEPQQSPINAITEPPSPAVGRRILKTWACAPFEQYSKWREAAKTFARQWVDTTQADHAEELFVSTVVLPAVIGLAKSDRNDQAFRLIEFAGTLALNEELVPLARTASGQARIGELQSDLRNYINHTTSKPL